MNKLKKMIIDGIFKLTAKKLDGHKTKIGGVGAILGGVVTCLGGIIGFLGNYFPEQGLPAMDIDTVLTTLGLGWTGIAAGFATLGLGGKAEKLKTAIEANGEANGNGTKGPDQPSS